MKIIRKSNYDLETVSDELIAENVTKYYARIIVDSLNEKCSDADFFEAVDNDYKLYDSSVIY